MQRQKPAVIHSKLRTSPAPSEGKNGTSSYSCSLSCVFTSAYHRLPAWPQTKHLGPDTQRYLGNWDKNQLDLDT